MSDPANLRSEHFNWCRRCQIILFLATLGDSDHHGLGVGLPPPPRSFLCSPAWHPFPPPNQRWPPAARLAVTELHFIAPTVPLAEEQQALRRACQLPRGSGRRGGRRRCEVGRRAPSALSSEAPQHSPTPPSRTPCICLRSARPGLLIAWADFLPRIWQYRAYCQSLFAL